LYLNNTPRIVTIEIPKDSKKTFMSELSSVSERIIISPKSLGSKTEILLIKYIKIPATIKNEIKELKIA
jgi:hypothetical protein